MGKTLNLDTFGEVMDNFIKENEINMLITIPEGSMEVEVQDNVNAGGVMQFYIIINSIASIAKNMKEDMKRTGLELDENKWESVVDSLLALIKAELMNQTDI